MTNDDIRAKALAFISDKSQVRLDSSVNDALFFLSTLHEEQDAAVATGYVAGAREMQAHLMEVVCLDCGGLVDRETGACAKHGYWTKEGTRAQFMARQEGDK
jgi:ribosomal protein L18